MFAQTSDEELALHLANVNGDGHLSAADEQLVRNAFLRRRGTGLRPAPEFDQRADVLGRGVIDEETLAAVRQTVRSQNGSAAIPRRPITVAWHYGWYNQIARSPGLQTVGFKGGDYASSDPEVESLFNDQKNEFGITVDAVSWIPPEFNSRMLDNYRRGLFRTPNLATRHFALLYESTISLPLGADKRTDFLEPTVVNRLINHFGRMARFLLELRDQAGGRIFRLDGRPVMFIFGSHTWGRVADRDVQLDAVDRAFDLARNAFEREFGVPPFVIGEEMALSATAEVPMDRLRRSAGFDGTHVYHHASSLKLREVSGLGHVVFPLTERYTQNQLGILEHTYNALRDVRNRHTGRPVLVIPNLAPGFAKPGLPTLLMKRGPYADFMRQLERLHLDRYINDIWANELGGPVLPAPVYIVGSWNEEFEGHSIFPAAFNESVGQFQQGGFDLAMAIKQVFGWNHYSARPIL